MAAKAQVEACRKFRRLLIVLTWPDFEDEVEEMRGTEFGVPAKGCYVVSYGDRLKKRTLVS